MLIPARSVPAPVQIPRPPQALPRSFLRPSSRTRLAPLLLRIQQTVINRHKPCLPCRVCAAVRPASIAGVTPAPEGAPEGSEEAFLIVVEMFYAFQRFKISFLRSSRYASTARRINSAIGAPVTSEHRNPVLGGQSRRTLSSRHCHRSRCCRHATAPPLGRTTRICIRTSARGLRRRTAGARPRRGPGSLTWSAVQCTSGLP
jgi:hypothetical protein